MRLIDWLTVGAAILAIVVFVLVIRTGHDERHDEDDARAYYDEHGHWPDETPEQVEQRRVASAAQAEALSVRMGDLGVDSRPREED